MKEVNGQKSNRVITRAIFIKQKGELNMEFEKRIQSGILKYESAVRYAALCMVRLALMDEYSPASERLKQYAHELKPIKNLLRQGHIQDDALLKELCRTVKMAVIPEQPAIQDHKGLLETIMANCVELAFLDPEVLRDKLPFEEKT